MRPDRTVWREISLVVDSDRSFERAVRRNLHSCTNRSVEIQKNLP
jgi:hypothetical protein